MNIKDFPSVDSAISVAVTRGNTVESRHLVHATLCDATGEIIANWGDSQLTIFPRSSTKIVQALGFLCAEKRIEFREEEIAIACATHHAQPTHLNVVKTWLDRLGLPESALECGAHDPKDPASMKAMYRAGELARPIHNNCSGKHTGMLQGCALREFPLAAYSAYEHPYQVLQRNYLSLFTKLDATKLDWGVDGCGLPTYAVPLQALALMYAQIANVEVLDSHIQGGIRSAVKAIQNFPELYGGTTSLSSKIVSGTKGRVIAKVGAEGVYGAAFLDKGLGLAVKCVDGSDRAADFVMLQFLDYLEVDHSLDRKMPLKNWSQKQVGEIRFL